MSSILYLFFAFLSSKWHIKSLHSFDTFILNLISFTLILFITSFELRILLFGLKGEYPWTISYNNIPNDHMSISLLYSILLTISGDIYSVVPQ